MAIVKCGGCGKSYSDRMPGCPYCTGCVTAEKPVEKATAVTKAPFTKKQWIIVLACLVGIVAAQIYSTTAMNRIEGKASKPPAADPAEAYVMSQDFVRDRLKSPATAKFPIYPLSAHPLGDNRFAIKSHVDSQNSFGALLRTRYSCTLAKLPDGRWRLENMEFEQN